MEYLIDQWQHRLTAPERDQLRAARAQAGMRCAGCNRIGYFREICPDCAHPFGPDYSHHYGPSQGPSLAESKRTLPGRVAKNNTSNKAQNKARDKDIKENRDVGHAGDTGEKGGKDGARVTAHGRLDDGGVVLFGQWSGSVEKEKDMGKKEKEEEEERLRQERYRSSVAHFDRTITGPSHVRQYESPLFTQNVPGVTLHALLLRMVSLAKAELERQYQALASTGFVASLYHCPSSQELATPTPMQLLHGSDKALRTFVEATTAKATVSGPPHRPIHEFTANLRPPDALDALFRSPGPPPPAGITASVAAAAASAPASATHSQRPPLPTSSNASSSNGSLAIPGPPLSLLSTSSSATTSVPTGLFETSLYGVPASAGRSIHAECGWRSVLAQSSVPPLPPALTQTQGRSGGRPQETEALNREQARLGRVQRRWVDAQRTAVDRSQDRLDHVVRLLQTELRLEHEREAKLLMLSTHSREQLYESKMIWKERLDAVDRIRDLLRRYRFFDARDELDELLASVDQWKRYAASQRSDSAGLDSVSAGTGTASSSNSLGLSFSCSNSNSNSNSRASTRSKAKSRGAKSKKGGFQFNALISAAKTSPYEED